MPAVETPAGWLYWSNRMVPGSVPGCPTSVIIRSIRWSACGPSAEAGLLGLQRHTMALSRLNRPY